MIYRKTTRSILLAATALTSALALNITAASAQDREYNFDVPAQPLDAALQVFARQADQQVIFAGADMRGITAPRLNGAYSADEALGVLLAGTGFEAKRTASGVLKIAANTDPQSGSAAGDGAEVEALIVTAQKREEDIQDVPIAISAFTQQALDDQKIEGGFDLLKAIPNVTFSKNNFTSYNFSIRGVGTKAISATTDPGVAVALNNSGLIVNRLFEQEYFDVERVEVLRGPQGTLYGRNATSGVINVVSAKPRLGEFLGDVKLEGGNYNAKRARGMINIPIGDTLALRLAGSMTKRDGYGVNLMDGSDVDDRDLWSTRVTLAWEPSETVRAYLLWERFEEDDQRVRTTKQLCHRDPGPDTVGSIEGNIRASLIPLIAEGGELSQGCLPGSLYDQGAFGTPNGSSLPFVFGAFFAPQAGEPGAFGFTIPDPNASCFFGTQVPFVFPIDPCIPDPYASRTQSRDLRAIESVLEPEYRAGADILELALEIDLTDDLTLTSQTVYVDDQVYSTQDFNRFRTQRNIFMDTAAACGNIGHVFDPENEPCMPGTASGGYYADLAPGGIVTDPQLGASDTMVLQDISMAISRQFNQEFRLASDFDGAVNFSVGANYTDFETTNDYFVFGNILTYLAKVSPFNSHVSLCATQGTTCVYIDPTPIDALAGDGHNYFRSKNPYKLASYAAFGELYWQAAEALKVTVGLRMTWDKKTFFPVPSQLLLNDYRELEDTLFGGPLIPPGSPPEACTRQGTLAHNSCGFAGTGVGGRGYPADPAIVQKWEEPTGRIVVDWKPQLPFTNETMLYASYSHGYKGGGANPPTISKPAGLFIAAARGVDAPETFEPEFIDAFEVGSKNVLFGGGFILNGAAFFYDYKDYQVSKIVDRSASNENFDATVWGLEAEWIYSPTHNLRFNGTFGHLQTRIADGEQSIDLMDRTQGNPDWMVVKPWLLRPSNCIAPREVVETLYGNDSPNSVFLGAACLGGNMFGAYTAAWPDGHSYDPLTEAPNAGAGFFADLSGNELPNAPHWTASLGAQYRMSLPGGWDATLRGDFYWQSQSFHRVYNTQYDKLRAWTNTNVSLWFEKEEWGMTAEVYVKNAFDETPITDAFLNSDDTGLTTNVFTLDPRLIGLSIRKEF